MVNQAEGLKTALLLLTEPTTTFEKVRQVVGILKGINKKLDSVLVTCEKACAQIDLVEEGAAVELTADLLPEETEEQKKRKKALLFFIKSWGELKSEVTRLQAELDQGHSISDRTFVARVLSHATGPLFVVTLLAVGVLVLSQASVGVAIANEGCSTIRASTIPIALPGFKLPSKDISSGSVETAELPPLSLTVDGTSPGTLTLSSAFFHYSIKLSKAVTSVTLNDQSLLGSATLVDLGTKPVHTLTITCKK